MTTRPTNRWLQPRQRRLGPLGTGLVVMLAFVLMDVLTSVLFGELDDFALRRSLTVAMLSGVTVWLVVSLVERRRRRGQTSDSAATASRTRI
ncbi:hypothetical protein [Nocardioides sp.]|uniref:hypothetical protein n=1 Tax=Nocardioides sp. TaxID=35761 RepID=UPI00356224B2